VNGIYPKLCLLLSVALCCPSARAAALAPGRTAFPDSVKEVSAGPANPGRAATIARTDLSPDEHAASMAFEVALRMRNFDEMQARIARGELISPAEKQARYFPLAADHDRVVRWLKAQGLEVTRTDDNHLGVFGRGSVDAVGAAFNVAFARVTAADGGEYTSAVSAPSLPDDISPVVLGIHGLQPHIRRHPLSTPRPVQPASRLNLSGYLPSNISYAYNATGLSATGAGQTIAIYSFAYPAMSDLTAFWTAAQVSQTTSNVQMIDVAGGPGASPGQDVLEEASLDVEWAGALAPGANIRVYGVNQTDPAENDEILQQVYADLPSNPSIHVLSISIGGNEYDVPRDYLIIEAQYMANLASSGVTVFVASGDNGATAENQIQTTYPTSDPDVTGVGGTTLVMQGNTVSTESAWSDSGGGISIVFSRPPWQVGTGVPAGNMRCVPDVASAADPQQGAQIIVGGQTLVIGGTSWAAPTWAGWCALIDQQRGSPLGLLNPRIYPLLGTTSFRDITSGSNGTYSAGVGYDLLTGIGVPDVTALLADNLNRTPYAAANVPSQLGNITTTIGQPATFFVVGEGVPAPGYQWQRMANGTTTWANLSDNGTYGGVSTPMLVVTGTTSAMTGDQFQCIVNNGSGSANSTPETLTVNNVGVTTLAGWPGSSGHVDGTGWAARFALAGGLRADNQGNVYASDSSNYTIRKISAAGVVTTVAGTPGVSGSTDGPVATALFSGVGGVAIDSAGDLYVADSGNYTIRKVSAAGIVSTLAGVAGTRGEVDGTGSAALLYDPQNLALDSAGNIYVSDGMGDVIRMITPAGVVTTLAGMPKTAGSADGTGGAAQFNDPTGITVDASGNVYVADYGNNTIRKIAPGGVVTTLAGTAGVTGSAGGSGGSASFNGPAGVGADSSGNIYVADSGNDLIRVVNPAGFVSAVAGAAGDADSVDGLGVNARFNTSGDVCVDNSGIVYVADAGNSTIRRIIPGSDSAPFFTAQPASQTVNLGSNATFSMGIAGTAPFSFQWNFNGAPIPGATNPSYTVAQAQQSAAGSYTVTVTNLDGSTTSSAAMLTIGVPSGSPSITAQPQGGPLPAGGSVELSVTATGSGLSYQWMLNGAAIAGATGSSYAATTPGSYTVAVSNSAATVVSNAAVVGSTSRLTNISTRAQVGTGGNILIPGLFISGSGTETLLIRADGPALTQYSVSGVLAQPTLSVFNSAGTLVASNTAWGTGPNPGQIATVSAQVGAFPLATGSADCALIANLTAGAYTVQVSGVNGTTGVALAEVYEVSATGTARLANISTRAMVGTGGNILIPGFYISGTGTEELLVRADGPALTQFGVSGVLAIPILSVYNAAGTMIATNTGWSTGTDSAQIPGISASVGAFPLAAGSADCALVVNLQPGSYTIQISGASGTSGVALAEIYEVSQ
jgi:sugar lactone lactonase YvrE